MSHLDPEQIEVAAQAVDAPPHLASCEVCRQAVRRAKARRALLAGLTPYTLSDHGFRRVEARVLERLADTAQAPWWQPLTWLVPAAAVVALAIAIWPTPAPGPDTLLPTVAAPAKFRPLPTLTVLAATEARWRIGEATWNELKPQAELRAGTTLTAQRVLLAPATEVSPRLSLSGTATLDAPIALGVGTLDAQVSADLFGVLAGPRRVEAVDSSLVVRRAAGQTTVDVLSGRARFVDVHSGATHELIAPVRARWADGEPRPLVEGQPEAAAPARWPAPPFAWLDLQGLTAGASVAIDGEALSPVPSLWAVTAGKHRLTLTPPGGRAVELELNALAGAPTPVTLADEGAEPPPSPEALQRLSVALRGHTPKLRACYEQWLKATPDAAGELVLALNINAKGRVLSAQVAGAAMSKAATDCLVRTAKGLDLPALGSPQRVEVPLVLRPAGKR